MLKEHRGKVCAYCAAQDGITSDHVFARGFLPPDKREGLPTVPACQRCNGEKAKLEHYLTAVLPFGGLNADARVVLEKMVPGRLEKNQRLARELATGASAAEGGGTGTLPIDGDKVAALFQYIVRGLAWHHWPEELTPEHDAKVWTFTRAGKALVWDEVLAKLNSPERVTVDLGDGALTYEAAKGTDAFHISIWHLQLLGGVTMRGENHSGVDEEIAHIFAIMGRKEFVARMEF